MRHIPEGTPTHYRDQPPTRSPLEGMRKWLASYRIDVSEVAHLQINFNGVGHCIEPELEVHLYQLDEGGCRYFPEPGWSSAAAMEIRKLQIVDFPPLELARDIQLEICDNCEASKRVYKEHKWNESGTSLES